MGRPYSHWKTSTFVAGLTLRGMIVPFVLDGPINRLASRPMSRRCWSPSSAQATSSSWTTSPATRERVRERIEAAGAELLFLPPYSPDLNPIEMAFSKLKALLRKAAERTPDGLWKAIGSILETFKPHECKNYFAAAG